MSVHAGAPPTRRAAKSARVSRPPRRAASSARRRHAAHMLARLRAERAHVAGARARADARAAEVLLGAKAALGDEPLSCCSAALCVAAAHAALVAVSGAHDAALVVPHHRPSRRARAEALARLALLLRRQARILHALARRLPSGHARACALTLGSDE